MTTETFEAPAVANPVATATLSRADHVGQDVIDRACLVDAMIAAALALIEKDELRNALRVNLDLIQACRILREAGTHADTLVNELLS